MDSKAYRAVFTGEHLKLVIRNEPLRHVVTREDLEATGMDPRWVALLAESTEGIHDYDTTVVVRWRNPLPLDTIQQIIESPTDREITSRAKDLEGDEIVAEINKTFEAIHGCGPSAKELKKCLRDTAAGDLIRERHQLAGLCPEAHNMAREEIARIKLAKSGCSEEEIRKLDFGPGTDIFLVGNNEGDSASFRSRAIPLNLAEAGTWTEERKNSEGKPFTVTHSYYRLPRRNDEAKQGIFHRACRTGRLEDGVYTHLVYYRTPTQYRRGVIVGIPMWELTELLQVKYKSLALLHDLWNPRTP